MRTNIYAIENIATNKWYVGQTVNPKQRFYQHMEIPQSDEMWEDIKKYGRSSFILHILAENVPLCCANDAEIAWYESCALWHRMYNLEKPKQNTRVADKREYVIDKGEIALTWTSIYDQYFPEFKSCIDGRNE